MKKQLQLGLVIEGKAVDCAVLRLPKIADELGPIKSGALRVARRLSNVLHAGYAVADYEELQAARLILLHVPDCSVSRIVGELCASDLDFRELSFVLCESWLMIDVLEALRQRDAWVATLMRAPSAQQNWFVVEGQAPAVRQMRRLLERNEARALEIRSGSKSLFFAAELAATVLPRQLLEAAEETLRASGLSGNPLSDLLKQMTEKMFNDFQRGARPFRGGPLAECSPDTTELHFENLRREYPQVAQIVAEQLEWAIRRMPELKAMRASVAQPVR